jgi:beta-lactamase regulating signal transducer with metallopeptidase domain
MDTLVYLASVTARSSCLAAAALAGAWLFRVKTAAARHAMMTVVTAGMLLMAALAPVLPPLPFRVLRAGRDAVAFHAPVHALEQPALLETRAAASSNAPSNSPRWRIHIEWPQAAAALYYACATILLLRLAYSYHFARSLVAASRREGDIYASAWISVPVTVGWLRPKILLPADWKGWAPNKLEAVLAHERTHIQRADWAIGTLAAVNRCVFWFTPLAWWLERKMALLAEQACDDGAVLTTGAREAYARALLDMAAAVSASRGSRIAWEAMAMARTAEVRTRIERILDETRQIPRGLTRARWAALLACCVPLIYLVTVVHPAPAQSPTPAIQAALAPAAQAAMLPAQETGQTQAAAPSQEPRPGNPPQPDRRFLVLYFETGLLTPADVPRYFAAFQEMNAGSPLLTSASGNNFFQSLMKPGDFVAVMSMTGGALRVNQDFTDDQSLVSKAVQGLALSQIGADPPDTDQRVAAVTDVMKILTPLAGAKALVYFSAGASLAQLASREQWRILYDLQNASDIRFGSIMLGAQTFQAFVSAMGRPPYSYVIPLSIAVLGKPDSTYSNPPEALAPGVEGHVQFRVTVSPAGRIRDAQFISGNPALESIARQMLAQFVYKPSGASHENPAGFETKAAFSSRWTDARPPARPTQSRCQT